MFGRPVTTCIPSRSDVRNEDHREQLERRRNDMTMQDGKFKRRELPPLHAGQPVRILDTASHTYLVSMNSYPAIGRTTELPSATPNGTTVRRNRSHLREMKPNTTPGPIEDAFINKLQKPKLESVEDTENTPCKSQRPRQDAIPDSKSEGPRKEGIMTRCWRIAGKPHRFEENWQGQNNPRKPRAVYPMTLS